MSRNKVALACMAHPDDVEFTCGGTLALLHQQGWEIHIATMTPGDCGSEQLSREEISRIRRMEAANCGGRAGRHVPLPRVPGRIHRVRPANDHGDRRADPRGAAGRGLRRRHRTIT